MGTPRRHKLEGTTVAGWNVLEYIGKDKYGRVLYKVRCKLCRGIYTRNGQTIKKSQGCQKCRAGGRIDINESGIKEKCQLASYRLTYAHYRQSAKSRGYTFQITLNSFISIINQKCTYCGDTGSRIVNAYKSTKSSRKRPATKKVQDLYNISVNGIDRKNNSKGYSKTNIAACCANCNIAKRDMSVNEFKTWIRRAYEHQNRAASKKRK